MSADILNLVASFQLRLEMTDFHYMGAFSKRDVTHTSQNGVSQSVDTNAIAFRSHLRILH